MHALVLAFALAASPDGGVVELRYDGGSCSYVFEHVSESKCHYEGKSATLNRETEKWRNREFEGDLPCGSSPPRINRAAHS